MGFSRLISLNKLPLWFSIIVGAIVGTLSTLGAIPAQYATTVILGLIIMLAVDALIERVGYLEKMEADLNKLNKTITEGHKSISDAIAAGKAQFSTREALNAREPFETFLKRGKDVLIIGLTLVGTVGPNLKFFERRVREGAALRFLLLNGQDEKLLELAALAHGVSAEALRRGVKSSLAELEELIKKVDEDKQTSVEIRLLKTLPTASITVVGQPRGHDFMVGEMRCELYIYKTGVNERPAFRLTPADDIFSQYKAAVEELWDNSEPYVAKSSTRQLAPQSVGSAVPVASVQPEKQSLKVDRNNEIEVENPKTDLNNV